MRKMRGLSVETGKAVYSTRYRKSGASIFLLNEEKCAYVKIKPDSLSFLVGEDRNGREVYEGDKVRHPPDGKPFSAAAIHVGTIKECELVRE